MAVPVAGSVRLRLIWGTRDGHPSHRAQVTGLVAFLARFLSSAVEVRGPAVCQ